MKSRPMNYTCPMTLACRTDFYINYFSLANRSAIKIIGWEKEAIGIEKSYILFSNKVSEDILIIINLTHSDLVADCAVDIYISRPQAIAVIIVIVAAVKQP